MFLKSLEIKGFKSFAEKTELEFKKGVTAVVGPNGSGKSNISDAVRWVLGEQSVKTLRGSKMEDVIFSGTQYRKSLGLAKVSLTLDNSSKELPLEYSDITITRKIFRSGESEYLINNSKCRLKDINSLFMDTGIGKEGYSLIGQGKIDAILSGRAEERRGLLEEAAGIVKFKSRKEESEKRLKNTEENLTRINDIVSTYEERLEPLRLENEKAKEFLNLSENLKKKEVSILVHKIKENNEIIKEQEKSILLIKDKSLDVSKEIETNKALLRDKEQCLEKIEENFNEDKAIYYKSKENSKELGSDIEILKERILNFKEAILNNDNLISEYNEKLDALRGHKNNIILNLKDKIKNQKNLNIEINSYENFIKEKTLFINKVEEDLNTLKDNKINSQRLINKIEHDLVLNDSQINNLKLNIDALEKNNANSENLIKINISTKNSVLEKLNKDNLQILDLQKDIDNKNNEINKYTAENSNIFKNISKLNLEFNKLEAKKSVLINLEEQYEGYTKSVKNLMEHLNKSYIKVDNIKVLGDVISVNKNLENAIETALGNSISNVITDNEIDAKRLIEYLKAKRLGRATFLPLNIIKAKILKLDEKIKKLNGFIGIASKLIEYKSKYTKAIESVLGRTIICSDMDSGLNIAKAINFSYRIVTLSGDVINPGGALTGGSSYNKSVGVISRKRDIEDLDKEIKQKKEELEKENKIIDLNKQKLKVFNKEVLKLKDKIQTLKVEIATATNEVRNIDKDILRIKDSLKLNYKDIDLIKEKIEKLNVNSKNYISEKINLEELESENNEKISKLDNLLKELISKISSNKDVMNEKKILKAQLDELILNKNTECKRIELESEELINKILNLSNSKKDYSENITLCSKNIEENNKNIIKLNDEIIILEKKFTNAEFQKQKLKEEVKKLNEIIENLSFENKNIEDEIHKNEIINTKKQSQMDNYFQKLNEEYNLTLAEAKDLSFKIDSEDIVLKDISDLKNKINKLGTVNVSSIEEYKEVLEKYTFMSNQIEDLSKSKEELLKVISEMTVKMKELFISNFKHLNRYFNETFRELFKGGSANLILCEGDELNSDIEINVQPPGKKLQNINLMSGGEKVLSAIALLFSILKMKPTPFCILDEIEAALDDANVYRYSEFLKLFSNNIQFIVITHRKGTMEASDIMYGVTMEEKGVSKIVSVDLNK